MPFYPRILKTRIRLGQGLSGAVPTPPPHPASRQFSRTARSSVCPGSYPTAPKSTSSFSIFLPLKTQAPFTHCIYVSSARLLFCFSWHWLCSKRHCSASWDESCVCTCPVLPPDSVWVQCFWPAAQAIMAVSSWWDYPFIGCDRFGHLFQVMTGRLSHLWRGSFSHSPRPACISCCSSGEEELSAFKITME